MPDQFEVTLSGIANRFFCEHCDTYNATYVLDRVTDSGILDELSCPSENCCYGYDFGSVTCGGPGDYLQLVFGDPSDYDFSVKLWHGPGGGNYGDSVLLWRKTNAEKQSCGELNDESIPPFARTDYCDNESSTCLVTAI